MEEKGEEKGEEEEKKKKEEEEEIKEEGVQDLDQLLRRERERERKRKEAAAPDATVRLATHETHDQLIVHGRQQLVGLNYEIPRSCYNYIKECMYNPCTCTVPTVISYVPVHELGCSQEYCKANREV